MCILESSLFLEVPAGAPGGHVCSKAPITASSGLTPSPGRKHSHSCSTLQGSHGRGDGRTEERIRKAFLERFELDPGKKKHRTPQPIQSYWWILLGHCKCRRGVGESNDTERNWKQIQMVPMPWYSRSCVVLFHIVPGLVCMANRIRQKGGDVTFEIRL